jgi:hypothetical protein
MKPALASTAATTLLDRDRIARLEELVANLLDRDEAREAEIIVLKVRVGMLEATQPAPRFGVPPEWITIAQATSQYGAARSTISRWVNRGKIVGALYEGRTFIDPESLRRALRS